MKLNSWQSAALAAAAAATIFLAAQSSLHGQSKADKSAVAGASQIAGLGSISGSVRAPKDFKAAKVFAHNIDKNVTYMVFTDAGRYTAVDLFPGNYEVTVAKNGFSSEDVQKITLAPGGTATADLTLQEGTYRPPQQARTAIPTGEPLLAYDELYPPGPGRQIIERTCIRCHGADFLPNHQWDADQWNAAIDLMQSTDLNSNPPGRISRSSVPEGISPQERQTLVDYLVKNFGPDSTRRGLAVPEAPLDEKALAKAEFIEYQVPPLANGPARRFQKTGHAGSVGVIAPYAKDFCSTCNRLRVTSRGRLRMCLFAEGEHSLRPLLQRDDQRAELQESVRTLLGRKDVSHYLPEGKLGNTRHFAAIGG